MKKIISLCLVLAILMAAAICVYAADWEVVFTSGSTFKVGGTATVDFQKTAWSVMESPSVTSEMYNAALEMNMSVVWRCSNGPDKTGKTITWTAEDAGKEYMCRVSFFLDKELTEFVDYIDSAPFTIPGSAPTIPTITTKSLPDATVGEEYYFKLSCSDSDVKWDLYRSSLPKGMYITQHGEIEGTPTQAGEYYIVVEAMPESGADYAAYAEFEFTVKEASDQPEYTIEIWEAPNKLVYTAGEKLDMTGLRVRIYGPDGYLDSVDGKYLTYSDKALVTLGEQKIALEYEDAFTVFIVTVVAAPEEETTAPTTEETEETQAATEGKKPASKGDKQPTTEKPKETPPQSGESTDNGLMYLAFALGGLTIGLGIAIVLLLVTKKKK